MEWNDSFKEDSSNLRALSKAFNDCPQKSSGVSEYKDFNFKLLASIFRFSKVTFEVAALLKYLVLLDIRTSSARDIADIRTKMLVDMIVTYTIPGALLNNELILRNIPTFWKENGAKIGFYFFTYEWSRRRLPLIKMINGVEEVLILLFTAFGYE